MRVVSLTRDELATWHAWKRVTESVYARVVHDVSTATGLSEPDYGVLSRLIDLGDGNLRQQALADSMGWHKSRLSHHLTRMAQRGFVTRKVDSGSTTVMITYAGRTALDDARPVHAAAVRRHLLDNLTPELKMALLEFAAELNA